MSAGTTATTYLPLVTDGVLAVPVGSEALDVNLNRLFDEAIPGEDHVDFEFLLQLLRDERPPVKFWCTIASHCWTTGHPVEAEHVCRAGIHIFAHPQSRAPEDAIPLQSMISSMRLASARKAPVERLVNAKYKVIPPSEKVKGDLFQEAETWLRDAEHARRMADRAYGSRPPKHLQNYESTLWLARAVHDLTLIKHDSALQLFERVLRREPNHGIALLGKGCILLRQRQYPQALQIYQKLLEITLHINAAPQNGQDGDRWAGPDPRIGIGLALWGLGRLEDARRAWKRSLALNPVSHSALTLLGLSALHLYKLQQPLIPASSAGPEQQAAEENLRKQLYAEATSHISAAFKINNHASILATALCEHFTEKASLIIESGMLGGPSDPQWTNVQGQLERALKLGEHAIQYADVARTGIQARLQFARALHIHSHLPGDVFIASRTIAQRNYAFILDASSRAGASAATTSASSARQLSTVDALAAIGIAQIQISTRNPDAAHESLSKFAGKAHGSGSNGIEILLLAGALKTEKEPEAALAMFERAVKLIEAAKRQVEKLDGIEEQDSLYLASSDFSRSSLAGEGLSLNALQSIAGLAHDPHIFVELANLAQGLDQKLAAKAYRAALRALEEHSSRHPTRSLGDTILGLRCQTNLGGLLALQALEINVKEDADAEARTALVGQALRELRDLLEGNSLRSAQSSAEASATEAIRIISTYNVGRLHELSDTAEAMRAYQAVLDAHPEYTDAKVRLALLHLTVEPVNQDEGKRLLKEALDSDPTNLDNRIVLACFLGGQLPGSPPAAWIDARQVMADVYSGEQGARIFGSRSAAMDLLERARKDAASLAVLGWAYYQVANAPKDPKVPTDRRKTMFRALDLFDKALAADGRCAFAAQGMAILLGEGVFSEVSTEKEAPTGIAQAAQDQRLNERRRKGADEAISILSKLREVREDGSVQICLGNAFMIKEEFDRAAKAYELASTRFFADTKPSLLRSISRAEYALGMSKKQPGILERSIDHLEEALSKLENAAGAKATSERQAIQFNQAVARQNLLQMLIGLPQEDRGSKDIEAAIAGLKAALRTFNELLPVATEQKLAHISADILDQRISFGQNLIKTGEKALAEQKKYEESMTEAQKQAEVLRQAKEQERKEIEQERERVERERAEELRARREAAKEKLSQVNWAVLDAASETKKSSKSKSSGGKSRRKQRDEEDDLGIVPDDNERDDEALFSGDESGDEEARRGEALQKLKRKKSGTTKARPRKSKKAISDDESTASDSSAGSDAPAKKKRKSKPRKKAAVEDDDDDRISSDEEI